MSIKSLAFEEFSYEHISEHKLIVDMESVSDSHFLIIIVCPRCARPVEFRMCVERGSKKRLDGRPDKGLYIVITCNECSYNEWDYQVWGGNKRKGKP